LSTTKPEEAMYVAVGRRRGNGVGFVEVKWFTNLQHICSRTSLVKTVRGLLVGMYNRAVVVCGL
jgi:hypothetical protein